MLPAERRYSQFWAYQTAVLRLALEALLASETPGNLRERTQLVRGELRGCKAFTGVSPGRWKLGQPSGLPASWAALGRDSGLQGPGAQEHSQDPAERAGRR